VLRAHRLERFENHQRQRALPDVSLVAHGLRVRVQGSGFRVQSSEFRVQSSEFMVHGSQFVVQGEP
jgi:hypothetical protein